MAVTLLFRMVLLLVCVVMSNATSCMFIPKFLLEISIVNHFEHVERQSFPPSGALWTSFRLPCFSPASQSGDRPYNRPILG
jgi:hypothetical protein